MKRVNAVPRVLVPVLGMIALALVVGGLPAQERQERARAEAAERPSVAKRAAPYVAMQGFGAGSYLGVYIREVTAEDVERLDLAEERGALVTDVPEEGPAADAGIETDDVIVSWNGSRVESAAQLRRVVGETPAGRSVEVGYVRDGNQRTAAVELEEGGNRWSGFSRVTPMAPGVRARVEDSMNRLRNRFEHVEPGERGFSHVFFRGGRLGAGVQGLTDQLAEYFGASDGGALVTSVQEDSPAEAAGLRAGDVIVGVGGESVENTSELMSEIARAEAGEIELRVLRDGREQTLRATLPERGEGMGGLGSGNAYFFGPEGVIAGGDFDVGVVWSDILDDLEPLVLPDLEMPVFELELPDVPDLELRLDDVPAAPRGRVIQT